MALRAGPIFCELKPQTQKSEPAPVQKLRLSSSFDPGQENNGKILLQPRLTTLRSFGSDPVGVIKTKNGAFQDDVSPFFATLSEYIESSKKSQDFEIISGRLAMVINFLIPPLSNFRKFYSLHFKIFGLFSIFEDSHETVSLLRLSFAYILLFPNFHLFTGTLLLLFGLFSIFKIVNYLKFKMNI